jgi:hypothetical protein
MMSGSARTPISTLLVYVVGYTLFGIVVRLLLNFFGSPEVCSNETAVIRAGALAADFITIIVMPIAVICWSEYAKTHSVSRQALLVSIVPVVAFVVYQAIRNPCVFGG